MSPTFAIVPSLDQSSVVTLATAKEHRDYLLKEAAQVTTVTDRMDADCAAATLKELKDFSKQIEAARSDAKAPITDLGRKIDATAKELTAEVLAQIDRIGRVCGAYEAAERAKAEEERRKAEAEAARIRREADRKALEAARAAESVEEAQTAAEEIQAQAVQKVAVIKQEVQAAAPASRPGLALRKEIQVEVTDIAALYRDNPHLCKIEANTAAIKAIIKANPNIQIPGVRHTTIDKF